jgi:signal transduction histidine kinase
LETLKKPLILIVDDTPKNIQVLGKTLHDLGYNVSIATSGGQALESVKKERPDLILLDIQMPEMDGFDVCKILKANPDTKGIPVIFLTAVTDSDKVVQGFELGAVDYITKPFNTAELTMRVATHIEIKQSREKLRELNASKDKFFSIIAHDLRNPFAALLLNSEMLLITLQHNDVEKSKQIADAILNSSEKGYDLLRNLLDWAQTQLNSIMFTPITIKLKKLVTEIIELVKNQANEKNITLTNVVPEDLLLKADAMLLQIIIRNLITNSIKFTFNGGSVMIQAKEDKCQTEISIIDTGIGMEKEMSEKLFRIDAKVTREGTTGETGTGLGLILCKEYVDRHGGKIWVESELGKGTKVVLTFPRLEEL